jgi:hypothetical protein
MGGRDVPFQSAFGETFSRVIFTPFIPGNGAETIPLNLAFDFTFTLMDDSTTGGNMGAALVGADVSILGDDLEPVFNFDGLAQLDLDFDDDTEFLGDWDDPGIATSDPLGSNSFESKIEADFTIEEMAEEELLLESDTFESIFSDGFESGDTSVWSSSSPDSFVITISSPDPRVRFIIGGLDPPVVAGDMNGDGVVNAFDIEGFVLALTNPAEFTANTGRDPLVGDVNDDGSLNAFDIGPFVDLLTGGAPALQLAQLQSLKSPSADDDGDGRSNAEELMEATNPYDSNDTFKILRFTPRQGGIEIEWKSSPGMNYSIECSDTAEPGSWESITGHGIVAGENATTAFIDSNESRLTAARMFYRVVLTGGV